MTNVQIAETISKQLGGINRLKTMTGAKKFVANGQALEFRFGGQRKLNFCRIALNSMDTYDVTFALRSFSRKTCETTERNVKKIDGVYCDQLIETFETATGLYLSL